MRKLSSSLAKVDQITIKNKIINVSLKSGNSNIRVPGNVDMYIKNGATVDATGFTLKHKSVSGFKGSYMDITGALKTEGFEATWAGLNVTKLTFKSKTVLTDTEDEDPRIRTLIDIEVTGPDQSNKWVMNQFLKK